MDLFIFAGEASGDAHGAGVIRELKTRCPHLTLEGVPGPKMRNLGVKPLLKMEEFQVMGFTDVFRNLPSLYKKFHVVLERILEINPKGVLLIDYPGFNLRLARALRKKGYTGKIIHYICPSVWAWGKGRIQTLSKYVDELFVIYPFEKKFFEKTSLKVTYIGNPSLEVCQRHRHQSEWRGVVGLPEKTKHLIALFPGSRQKEIERNLKMQLEAAEMLAEQLPGAHFALSVTSPKLQASLTPYLSNLTLSGFTKKITLVPSQYNYELMSEATSALAKSGTITLELALLGCPTTVVYGLTPFNRFVAKYILRLKLPYYCIVNILANRKVFPELIEKGFSSKTMAEELLKIETHPEEVEHIKEGCREVAALLGPSTPSATAACRILELCDIK